MSAPGTEDQIPIKRSRGRPPGSKNKYPRITASRDKEKPRARPRGYLESWNPQPKTLALLEQVDAVLETYRDHLPLSVRQVFYRLIGAFGYPKEERAYIRLGETLQTARRSKRIPFEAIRDDGVSTYATNWYRDLEEFRAIVNEAARRYRRDLLARQPYHLEVWCEAAGMLPQLNRVADRYCISVYSGSGFDSVTAKWNLAQRLCNVGKPAIILHLGDFDPSGVTLFENLREDTTAFFMADRIDMRTSVRFVRVALTEEQVKTYDLPTAPAKVTGNSHARRWGDAPAVQLEALAPDDLAGLLRIAIEDWIDEDVFYEDLGVQARERQQASGLLAAPKAAGDA